MKKEETEILKIYLKNNAGSPVDVVSLSPLAIPGAEFIGGETEFSVRLEDKFDLAVGKFADEQTGTVVIFTMLEERKGVGKKGRTFAFNIANKQNGVSSFRLNKKDAPVFLEYIHDCFRWLFIGLAYDVTHNGGEAEKLWADELRKQLITRYQGKEPQQYKKTEV